ncbi:Sec-independent protein translocase protein TatB [Salinicola avicenniae]|uniref:Sec-independent protein translocase protein TatB n=1 Tax=Salinicola avicenniae TaxID=2916836 RepID=UPI0020739E3C|nr:MULTISPECIES: Sec-independent protein translocase protein TatB [unclassified Salinicola]
MFDIGFFELLLIGIVGLLVLGPERLPRAARTAGLWVGRIKRSVSTMQREITSQLEAEELRQKLAEQQKKLDDSVNQTRRGIERTFETEDERQRDRADSSSVSGAAAEAKSPASPSADQTSAADTPVRHSPQASPDEAYRTDKDSPADKDSAAR